MIRKIVHIDQDKCDGCGLCVPSCAEGAIRIVDGKAQIAADNLCDGLGACLGDCPQDAITIIERDAELFDEEAVEKHLHVQQAVAQVQEKPAATAAQERPAQPAQHHGGCPGSRAISFAPAAPATEAPGTGSQPSRLAQWPVQLQLVPATAPYFQDADLLITADCVPFAYPDYHRDFLAGKAVVIACPKLDDLQAHTEKLTAIFRQSSIKSITVLRMEVPCCGGIVMATRQALAASGKEIPLREVTIGIRGEVVAR
ncbi:MAG: 4Fe-4S ferredoxin [Geobacteraceae bacterium GWC2_58_44]|nr:MAG: 4Fe-4S ferredoxin [Geobacteraceae bacterium GWC2_58_44]HBG08387.1 4Fe-4S ferredoxin [Geobacter sp.]